MVYETHEVERIFRLAAEAARKRKNKLTMVDKANVLEASRLWRRVCAQIVEEEYADLEYDVVLVDAMAAAHSFRNLAPDLFEILTQCPATFVKQREGGDMLYFRPHIVLDPFGEITTVNWSPPFEGPLGVPADMVKDYYVAYTAFQKMVDNSLPAEHGSHTLSPSLNKALSAYANEYTWEQALRPGEILVFNNRRMLHGRRGFSIKEGTNGSRHLIGCYANIDETLNRYRLLLRQNARDQDWTIKNAGNGSVGTCFPSREPTSQT